MECFPNVKKIAVLRATVLGDYVGGTPALYALRNAYPDAEIVYLGNPWHKAFLEGRPAPVDRVEVVPVYPGVREEAGMPDASKEELDAFFAEMQQEQFDLAIQLHGGGRNSNPFVLRLGARHTVGTATPDAIRLERWMPYFFFQNEFTRWLELVRLAGATEYNYEPYIAVTQSDCAEVAANLPELQRPFIVIHPGSSEAYRRWHPERFAAVGDALAQQGYQIVVTGIEAERCLVEKVLEEMQYPAVNACARLSVSGLTGLLSQATLMICNDTGPMHVAVAVGTATIGIFWCQNYPNWSHLHRSNHRPLVSWVTHCPACGEFIIGPSKANACGHDACYLAPVTVEDVLLHAYDLLDIQASQPSSPVIRNRQPNPYSAVMENFVERTENDLLFRSGFHRFT